MNKLLKISLIILMFFSLVYLLFFFMFYPRLKINNKEITIELNQDYKEESYQSNNLFLNTKSLVKVENNINNKKVGEYQVTYKIDYLFFKNRRKVKVNVVDTESPIITLNGNLDTYVCPNSTYVEEGYTAIDNYDKDITNKVKIKTKPERIKYTVKDSSNNISSVTRNIIYHDIESPTITLTKDSTITLYLYNTYNEPGYTATDNCDNDITSLVTITSNVDTSRVGEYNVTYKVTDTSGNEASINRTVKVIKKVSNGPGNGIIYLTFDDGPSSSITPYVLDILKEENVKATFFVIGYSSDLDYLIKRAHDEGHTIALHSATHNYATIYSSIDNYFNDLNSISTRVKNITGEDSKIIRFPGGSSNTVSTKYSWGIMTTLVSKVTDMGYHYFDWNISSGDAGGTSTSEGVYNNVVNNLSHSKTNVVLMHDYSGNYKTLYALKDIIEYGKNNGYTFSSITMSTPQVIHHVAN